MVSFTVLCFSQEGEYHFKHFKKSEHNHFPCNLYLKYNGFRPAEKIAFDDCKCKQCTSF